jgi:hypothetical protein
MNPDSTPCPPSSAKCEYVYRRDGDENRRLHINLGCHHDRGCIVDNDSCNMDNNAIGVCASPRPSVDTVVDVLGTGGILDDSWNNLAVCGSIRIVDLVS